MRQRVLHSLVMIIGGLGLLLCPHVTEGEDEPSLLEGCAPILGQGPKGEVSLYIAKTRERPGRVCVRVINGLSPSVGIGTDAFRLQKRDDGQFRDFRETPPDSIPGIIIGGTADRFEVLAGNFLDRQLPLFGPAPPGMYRVCFRYALHASTEEREVCSEEFSLP